MTCTAVLAGDGPIRCLTAEEAAAYSGRGFVWIHIEGTDEEGMALLAGQAIPDVASNALVATETRPRCDVIDEG
ncbi:MAG TPA: zinc transporter ZntB, partial [Allosphingosinicella sp.]|nr:zinc transporter ZntB [Allosphingosinicella sp.]